MTGVRIAVGLAAAVALAGCASAGAVSIAPLTAPVACEMPVPDRDLLVGVALSGGGSPAALFGAAGLEALAGVRTADGGSLADRLAHLSSVSGGSLAASYYALKKPSLKQLQAKRARRALIIAFDSSFPFSVGERRLSLRSLPFTILTFDFSRIPSIMEERASTYHALFFRSLQMEGVIPDVRTINVMALRHTDAKWAPDLSDLPPACKAEPEPLQTPADVRERIAEIPTRLFIASECDRQLLSRRRRSWSPSIAARSSSSSTGRTDGAPPPGGALSARSG